MCGIVGALRRAEPVLPFLVDGLRVLEYRGYDSVGIGIVLDDGIVVRRKAGRIAELDALLAVGPPLVGTCGIGHSRWATHGPPTDANAHPHLDASGRVALVHNGIIENHAELREALVAQGSRFRSETDTEVLAHLIGRELDGPGGLSGAVERALAHVRGYYAIAVLSAEAQELVCAREGPPICVAVTPDAAYLASDALAILPHTRDVIFLEDGDVAAIAPGRIEVRNRERGSVERPVHHIEWNAESADRGAWPHFMLKEIHEQPDVVGQVGFDRLDPERGDVRLAGELWTDGVLRETERIQLVACGTAFHAALVTRYLIEGMAGIPVDVDYASEFRYRDPVLVDRTLALGISQSGETADTLAALRLAAGLGARIGSICNAIGSSMVRESESTVLLRAGPEIGVASTKAFVAMLVAGYLLAVRVGRARGRLSVDDGRARLEELHALRPALERLLAKESVGRIRQVAHRHADAKGFLFLGRGINYPIALEGALKLKEISYVHAEGYPAGEMKHGPIALIEPGMSTVVIASRDGVAEKVRSNVEQVRARGGGVICVGSDPESLDLADDTVEVPDLGRWLSPVLNVVPLQLFAYHVADRKGCDIDKPRNLAKSVTVE